MDKTNVCSCFVVANNSFIVAQIGDLQASLFHNFSSAQL